MSYWELIYKYDKIPNKKNVCFVISDRSNYITNIKADTRISLNCRVNANFMAY